MLVTTDEKGGVLRGMRLNAEFIDLVRTMPGRKRWRGRELAFELSASNIDFIRETWPEAVWESVAEARRLEVEALRKHEDAMRQAKRGDVISDAAFRYKTKPFDHQAKAFMLSRDKPVYALLMEMGTGKTKVILDTAAYLWSANEIDTLVVVAPNGVHRSWIANQVPTHLPDWTNYKAAYYSSSARKNDRRKLEAALAHKKGLRVIALNVEMFSTQGGLDRFAGWFATRNGTANCKMMLVVDESTRIKSPSANRARNVRKAGALAPYRRIMSGSPISKGVEDLYGQFTFLSPDILGFTTFTQFTMRYCIMGGFERREIVGYRNVDEIKKRIDAYSFRVTKAECLDLPPKLYVEREVELTPEQRKAYSDLRDVAVTELQGQTITTPQAITLLLRLQQIVCGFLPGAVDDGGRAGPLIELPSNRVDAVIDVLTETQGKTIIWARFKHDIDAIARRLELEGYRHVVYFGDVSDSDRERAVNLFQKDPRCVVFLGTPASGGLGLDLWAATTVIYFSNDFNAEVRWQSEDRAHRIGQKHPVTYVDLIAPNTIDRKIARALKNKRNVADMVLDPSVLLDDEGGDEGAGVAAAEVLS